MKHPSLKINFIWAFLGNGFAAFCMWLLLVILTKFGEPENVGLYALASAVGLPISMFFSLRLQIVQITDAKREYDFGHYFAVKIVTAILTFTVIAGVAFGCYSAQEAWVITTLGAGYGIIAFREVFLAVMQKAERMDQTAISRFIQSALSVVFFAALYGLTKSLAVSLWGLIAARLIGLVCFDIPVSRRLLKAGSAQQEIFAKGITPHWHWKKLFWLICTSIPLGMVAWLGTLFTSIPRLMIDQQFGKDQLGYFAAVSSLLVVGNILWAAVGQSVMPRLSKYFVETPKGYLALVVKLLSVSLLFGIAGIMVSKFFGRQILTLLFTAEYAAYSDLFVWIMTAAAILFVFSGLNIALTAARCFKVQVPIYAICAAVCGVASWILIPQYGIIAGAWALLACYIAGALSCLSYLICVYRKRTKEFYSKVIDA